jgi:hypothetical protein
MQTKYNSPPSNFALEPNPETEDDGEEHEENREQDWGEDTFDDTDNRPEEVSLR